MRKAKKCLWAKVTKDKYEWILELEDSAEALAEKCGTTVTSVRSGASHYDHGDTRHSSYRRIVIDEDEEDGE